MGNAVGWAAYLIPSQVSITHNSHDILAELEDNEYTDVARPEPPPPTFE